MRSFYLTLKKLHDLQFIAMNRAASWQNKIDPRLEFDCEFRPEATPSNLPLHMAVFNPLHPHLKASRSESPLSPKRSTSGPLFG